MKKKQILVKLIVLQAKRMGRKPAGEKKLSNAAKQKTWKERQAKKEKKQRKVYEGPPTSTQGKGETRVKKKKRKETKNTANNNIDEEPLVVNMKFPALFRSLKQAKSSLSKDRAKNELFLKLCLRALSQ